MKATKKDVGKIGIPHDNSYCVDIPWGNDAYDVASKEVLIIGVPYELKFKTKQRNSHPKVREFINVMWEDKYYRVLNSFKKIKRKKEENEFFLTIESPRGTWSIKKQFN